MISLLHGLPFVKLKYRKSNPEDTGPANIGPTHGPRLRQYMRQSLDP
jgi:hypothetical protein